MIKNERQYKMTRTQAERFTEAIAQLSTRSLDPDVHPTLRDAQQRALESQLGDLRAELTEYESLRSGQKTVLHLESISDLPRGLIRARIAAGVTHKELAERLGVPEQQVQRYEATDYATVTVPRLAEIARALGVSIREDIYLPKASVTTETVYRRLAPLGLDAAFLSQRLGVSRRARSEKVEDADADDSLALRLASIIQRIFGIAPEELFSDRPLMLSGAAVVAARFKKGARGNKRRADAYTVYAHYIALLVLDATMHLENRPIPTEPETARAAIVKEHGKVTFETALRWVWSLGIAVVPLSDPGAFHGACWRTEGRNVIVLKQRTTSSARWLFDLLHELFHAGQEPQSDERTILEAADDAEERLRVEEEQHATRFAGEVSLEGRAHALAEECVNAARGKVELLKSAVPKVATKHRVDVGALANYVAFCLATQKINWWGTANNLQELADEPRHIARSLLLEKLDYSNLNEIDRQILIKAFSDSEV